MIACRGPAEAVAGDQRAAEVGVVVAPRGRLIIVLAFTARDGRIAGYDMIADPARLRQLGLAVPGEEI
jgi:coenzyme F420-reducing hydrogenase alpha subunit